jgi:SAM-dependent methyltransferase
MRVPIIETPGTVASVAGQSGDTVTYIHGHAEPVLRSHRWRTAANSAAYVLPRMRAGDYVLDVGCGPGTITADIAAVVAPGRVTALEISEQALAPGRAEVARRGQLNVEFAVGDVQALSYPDGHFDVVHAHQVLQHVVDPVQALREMARVCRTGGTIAARDADYAAFSWYPHLPELDEWRDLYRQVARANGGEPDAGRRLLAWANAAGYRDTSVSASVWCFATSVDREWWGGMWADRILHSDVGRHLLDRGLVDPQRLAAISAAWRAWAAHPDGWLVIVHGELLATR